MAELSVEEIRRLTRNFLIGKGGPGELEDLKRSMDSDAQLPLELLQQMQTALDEVPPAGFTPDQWKEVDARVASLVNPMVRSGLGFIGRFFSSLFKKKPAAEGAARLRRRGAAPEPEAPAPAPVVEAVIVPSGGAEPGGEGLEEMAPIAAPAAAPAAPAQPVAQEEAPSYTYADAEAKPVKKTGFLRSLSVIVAALGLCAVLGYGGLKGWDWWKSRQAKPLPLPVAPTPVPTPKYSGPPRRSQPPVDASEYELPSELPRQTPAPAGVYEKPEGLETKDSDGNRGFPLP